MSIRAILEATDGFIRQSYAHNSPTFHRLETAASLEEIVAFLRSARALPPFDVFLRQWLSRIPASVQPSFRAHLELEEREDHAELNRRLTRHLLSLVADAGRDVATDPEIDELIGYSFAPERVHDRPVGYFLGCFWATEILSSRRSLQLYNGLTRLGVDRELTFLEIHLEADSHHSAEVATDMILPSVQEGSAALEDVLAGVLDRVDRSGRHLQWFEARGRDA